jgi:hypothetical protein
MKRILESDRRRARALDVGGGALVKPTSRGIGGERFEKSALAALVSSWHPAIVVAGRGLEKNLARMRRMTSISSGYGS